MHSEARTAGTRGYNRRVTLELIRLYGPISRTEIAKRTGLTLTGISKITSELIEQGIVEVKGRRQGQRGQPAVDLEVNAEGGHSVGVHWDRDHLSFVLINLIGTVKHKEQYEIRYPDSEKTLSLMADFIQSGLKKNKLKEKDLWGIGVAFPGPFKSLDRNFTYPANFPQLSGFPIQEKISELIPVPVIIEHDATAAAIGEQFHHSDSPNNSFFYIYIGHGLGGGMILNGSPYRGAFGNAASISMVGYDPQRENSYCGELVGIGYLSQMLEEEHLTISSPSDLIDLSQKKHPIFMEWLEQVAQRLAHAIIAVDALIDPEIFYLGGRLPEAVSMLLIEKLTGTLEKARFGSQPLHRCQLLKATTDELAAAIGAATLPFYETMSPQAERF